MAQALWFVFADPSRFYRSSSGGIGDHILRLILAVRARDEDARQILRVYGRRGASLLHSTDLGTRFLTTKEGMLSSHELPSYWLS